MLWTKQVNLFTSNIFIAKLCERKLYDKLGKSESIVNWFMIGFQLWPHWYKNGKDVFFYFE